MFKAGPFVAAFVIVAFAMAGGFDGQGCRGWDSRIQIRKEGSHELANGSVHRDAILEITDGLPVAECSGGITAGDEGSILITGGIMGDPSAATREFTRDEMGIFGHAFLGEIDCTGSVTWVRYWGGQNLIGGKFIDLDDLGNIYVAGTFKGTGDFDPGPSTVACSSIGDLDVFLCKFDSSGRFQWVRTWGNQNLDDPLALAVSQDGHVYVVGALLDPVDFDPGPGSSVREGLGSYLTCFDSEGVHQWVCTWGGLVWDFALDQSGNFYLTGQFNGTTDLDPGSGIAEFTAERSSTNGYLLKLDSGCGMQWVRTWGGEGSNHGTGVAVGSSGTVFVTGFLSGEVDFDSGPGIEERASSGSWDAFASSYDRDGNLLWVRSWGGGDDISAHGLTLDQSGGIYITGSFTGTVDFDPGPDLRIETCSVELEILGGSFSLRDYDAFLSKFDGSGEFQWVATTGGDVTQADDALALLDSGIGIAVDTYGIVHWLGRYGVEQIFLKTFLPDGTLHVQNSQTFGGGQSSTIPESSQ